MFFLCAKIFLYWRPQLSRFKEVFVCFPTYNWANIGFQMLQYYRIIHSIWMYVDSQKMPNGIKSHDVFLSAEFWLFNFEIWKRSQKKKKNKWKIKK